MKKIFILVPETAVPSGITGPRYLFTMANLFLQQAGKARICDIKLFGELEYVGIQDGSFQAATDLCLENSGQADLVIIPPVFGELKSCVKLNESALPWIRGQYKTGAEV